MSFLLFLSFFLVLAFELRVLPLLSRCFTTWATPPVLLHYSAPAGLGSNPPKYASCIAGITGVHNHAQLVCWEGISPTFSQLASNLDLPDICLCLCLLL
jgi:hypothetical protein